MKIIINNASRLCKCHRCKSELEVSPSDIKTIVPLEKIGNLSQDTTLYVHVVRQKIM